MLDSTTTKKLEDFVYAKPRSIQEIAQLLNKNWRTADRYVKEIEKNFGTISTRTFRGGTRGALKIVFWASMEKISHSVFQERLEEEILRARKKEDFSAFDIFQHVSTKNKVAHIEEKEENTKDLEELFGLLEKTEKQLLIFSGNLSFLYLKHKNKTLFQVIELLVKRNVTIKILCRIDLSGRDNIQKILSLNFKHGKENIEIKHREHPLRAFIIDGKVFRIKEVKEPTGKMGELDKRVFIFYTIKDKEWTEWLSKVFWKMFSASVGADKRLEEMEKIVR
ncbi:hypothetical protein HZC30_03050 [Candidatus Woesearchaeota archaeon]|nr:hypothetical protein [Candidatus Woesearchaeota archaeon]